MGERGESQDPIYLKCPCHRISLPGPGPLAWVRLLRGGWAVTAVRSHCKVGVGDGRGRTLMPPVLQNLFGGGGVRDDRTFWERRGLRDPRRVPRAVTGQEEAEGNPGQKQVEMSHHEMKMDKKAGIRGEG